MNESVMMVRQLRKDATKLETVARHLRLQAKEIISSDKRAKRVDQARKDFYELQLKSTGESVNVEKIFQEGITSPAVADRIDQRDNGKKIFFDDGKETEEIKGEGY